MLAISLERKAPRPWPPPTAPRPVPPRALVHSSPRAGGGHPSRRTWLPGTRLFVVDLQSVHLTPRPPATRFLSDVQPADGDFQRIRDQPAPEQGAPGAGGARPPEYLPRADGGSASLSLPAPPAWTVSLLRPLQILALLRTALGLPGKARHGRTWDSEESCPGDPVPTPLLQVPPQGHPLPLLGMNRGRFGVGQRCSTVGTRLWPRQAAVLSPCVSLWQMGPACLLGVVCGQTPSTGVLVLLHLSDRFRLSLMYLAIPPVCFHPHVCECVCLVCAHAHVCTHFFPSAQRCTPGCDCELPAPGRADLHPHSLQTLHPASLLLPPAPPPAHHALRLCLAGSCVKNTL